MFRLASVHDAESAQRIGLLAQFALLSFISSASVATVLISHGVVAGALFALAVTALACWMLKRPAVLSCLGGGLWTFVPIGFILLLMALSNERHYLAERHAPNFATSAPALEVPAWRLLHGYEPYRDYLAGGAPISPGPGWIILLSPFTVSHLTGILGAVSLGVGVIMFRRKDRYAACVFFAVMVLQPIFEAQIANGQDLYVVSIALVCLSLAAERLDESARKAIVLGVVAGFVATARIPIVLMTGILGIGVYKNNRRTGCYFMVAMLLTCGVLHAAFALWSYHAGHFYQPMHIFGRASKGAGLGARMSVVVMLTWCLAWVALRMRPKASHWMLGMYFAMFALFTPEAIKEFMYAPRLDWEGSTYITFPLPLLLASLVLISRPTRSGAEAVVSASTGSWRKGLRMLSTAGSAVRPTHRTSKMPWGEFQSAQAQRHDPGRGPQSHRRQTRAGDLTQLVRQDPTEQLTVRLPADAMESNGARLDADSLRNQPSAVRSKG